MGGASGGSSVLSWRGARRGLRGGFDLILFYLFIYFLDVWMGICVGLGWLG